VLHKSSAATAREAKSATCQASSPRTAIRSAAPQHARCVSIRSRRRTLRSPAGKVLRSGTDHPPLRFTKLRLVVARSVDSRSRAIISRRQPAKVTWTTSKRCKANTAPGTLCLSTRSSPSTFTRRPTEIVARAMDILLVWETRFARGIDQSLADLLYASGCRRPKLWARNSISAPRPDAERTKVTHVDTTVERCCMRDITTLFVIHGFPGENARGGNPHSSLRTVCGGALGATSSTTPTPPGRRAIRT